ncbi:hypothetical protein [Pelagibacterium limicola]|uniref:hypothetical protein n=1 Tax=Pelagibacterium limicola TaxID=2791022 RepID=UPI0018AF7752|nr:hypothetical protein [Pelagibacterium limicola]
MKKLSALALGTAMALAAPIAINAQDTDLGVGLDGGVGVELGGDNSGVDAGIGVDAGVGAGTVDGAIDAGAEAGVNVDELTHADLEAAIQSSGALNLDVINGTANIEVVAISDLAANDGGDASVVADTRAQFEGDISALQDDIAAKTELVAALEAEGYAADDVVAVWMHGSGDVVLFVDA